MYDFEDFPDEVPFKLDATPGAADRSMLKTPERYKRFSKLDVRNRGQEFGNLQNDLQH